MAKKETKMKDTETVDITNIENNHGDMKNVENQQSNKSKNDSWEFGDFSETSVSPVSPAPLEDDPTEKEKVENILDAVLSEEYDETTMGDWEMEDLGEIEGIVPMPTFSEKVKDTLPDFLKEVASKGDGKEDTDLLLIGSIVSLSVCMTNTSGLYFNNTVYPNLFLFISAPAAAGKSRIKLCKQLVMPVHERLRREDAINQQEYLNRVSSAGEDSNITPPPIKTLIIPADSSSTSVYQILNDNRGVGLIFDTEGDTLANNFKSEHGDFSEGFRKAFHHETISYARRKDREFVEINHPTLSAVLSGTPQQVLSLIPNEENGLFSRFIFYNMNLNLRWKNVFKREDVTHEEFFNKLAKQFYDFYCEYLGEKKIEIRLSKEQEYKFNKFFAKLTLMYFDELGCDFTSTTRRMGLIAYRILLVLATLRIMETGDVSEIQYCDERDFQNSLIITSILVQHSAMVFHTFPSSGRKQPVEGTYLKHSFFENLPHEFDRKKFLSIGAQLGIPSKTAEKYITAFCKQGRIIRYSQGKYRKP